MSYTVDYPGYLAVILVCVHVGDKRTSALVFSIFDWRSQVMDSA